MAVTIEQLIASAEQHEASDLFITEGCVGRAKIGGRIMVLGDDRVEKDDMASFWRECGADPDIDWDKDAAYESGDGIRFRVNLHRTMGRLSAVLRQIRTQVPNMESLGLPESLLVDWMSRPSGFVLVTGATGCGKSTTLASCLEWVNCNMARHIVTIEDPAEFLFENKQSFFTQREVHTDTDSYAKGLRSALRQAPHIIFVGEIRDAETATIALQAAETGHLVLATLHSSHVTDTLERLTNLFPAAERDAALLLLSGQLIGILSQQLLPGADGTSLTLVCEHLQNSGATRDWIREVRLPEIGEFLPRRDDPANRNFLRSLVEAVQEGRITHETGEASAWNAHEFNRALRGVY